MKGKRNGEGNEMSNEKFCPLCKEEHEKIAFCTKCNACLYKNSTQVKDDVYPLFKCTKCGQINFWD